MATAIASSCHRRELFKRFESVIQTNGRLDRTLVSFQANRKLGVYRWLKYKEGFSAKLVQHLLDEYGTAGETLLDPFAGIGTSLFEARDCGLHAIGIELMPVGFLAMQARLSAEQMANGGLRRKISSISDLDWHSLADKRFAIQHILITEGAFPPKTERSLAGYRA